MVDWWIARVSSNFHMYLRAHVGASHGGCLETRHASGSNVFVTNRYEIFVRQDIPFQPRTNFDVARTPPLRFLCKYTFRAEPDCYKI